MNNNYLHKTREQILEERKEYYSKTFILMEMVKCLYKKELAFLTLKTEEKKKALRYMSASTIDYLQKHMNFFYINQSLINFYTGIAKFKNHIPVFTYNLEERKKEEKYKHFNDNFYNYVEKVDLFFDLDGKEHGFEKMYDETKILKHILDELEVPYYIIPSSFKGFHIIIPSEYMPQMDLKDLLIIFHNIIYNLKGIYQLKCLDESVIDIKRLRRCPYSYSCDGSICLPLDDLMFQNFQSYMITMGNVLKFQRLKNRGLLVRTYNYKDETLKKHVLNFISEYE